MHIYDSRFPYMPGAVLNPPEARVDAYRALQNRLGTSRTVVVTPSTYGTDNSCTLDAMAQLGPSARGVAVVDPGISDTELRRLADLGIQGVRFNVVRREATSIEMIEPVANRVADFGMHVQLHMKGDDIVGFRDMLRRLPATLVFDHLGRIPYPDGMNHGAYKVIRDLIDRDRAWVKVSGVYHESLVGAPSYADTSEMAASYVEAAPERVVWGSDWPHPTLHGAGKPMPDDAVLADLLVLWAPDEAVRHRILVENPARLYGFSEPV
ncbi:MAG TPA: amidohydrolase family protein [Arenibaculum sp.]|nr:amidohydrolase family protein [Arenibaculum sp.]